MKKIHLIGYIIIYLMLFCTHKGIAQGNLIPNGSFELPPINYTEQLTTVLNYTYDNLCATTAGGLDIDNWWVNAYYPERMVVGTQPNCRDNDLAQDGTSYMMLQHSDDLLVNLTDTLEVGCLYQFTCFLNLETFDGTSTNPAVMMFFLYMPDGNTIQSPIIYFNLWQQFSVPFVATAPSTRFEVNNWVFDSGLQIDNISIVKMGCPLPVTWLYIRTKGYEIEFATASETNSDKFEVINSEGQVVAVVKAAGNTTQNSYYRTTVKKGFYIIRQIDIDGKYSYSKMVRVSGKDEYEYSGMKFNPLEQRVEVFGYPISGQEIK